MLAGKLNITIEQGAEYTKLLQVTDVAETPIPWGGYTARMHIRRTVQQSGDPVLALTTENGRITLGPTDGDIHLLISAADTAALPTGNNKQSWRYDLELVPAGGQVVRLLEGKVVVKPEVTRG